MVQCAFCLGHIMSRILNKLLPYLWVLQYTGVCLYQSISYIVCFSDQPMDSAPDKMQIDMPLAADTPKSGEKNTIKVLSI